MWTIKPSKEYQFRAYELEGKKNYEKADPSTTPLSPTSHSNNQYSKKDSTWEVETFLDTRQAYGIKKAFKQPNVAKEKKVKKDKKPHKWWFFSKKRPSEVSPLESGAISILDILAPASSDFRHRDYVVVDGVYHSYLYITGYGYTTAVTSGWLSPLVEIGEGINLSFTIHRQQKDKILPKIAQTTMLNRSRMRDVSDTRQDFEELDSAIDSGLWMKDEMNRNGEDFYYMNTIIEVTADDPDTLERRVEMVEARCTSLNMVAKRCDYKHEQAFLSSLPLLNIDIDIERKSRRNALTTGVAAAFPFSSFEICDQTGIMLGINLHNRSICMVDPYYSRIYPNAHFCLLGMSGAGKTMLLQILGNRFRQQGIPVMVVAPFKGYEYRPLCETLGGTYIKLSPSSNDCINIFEIFRKNMDIDAETGRLVVRDDSLLADKISRLHIYYSLLLPNMTVQERNILDTALVEVYRRKGITYDNMSLNGLTSKDFPIREDLLEILKENPDAKNLALVESRFVNGSAKRLGGYTNVNLDCDFIVLDTSEMPKDLLASGTFIATDFCTERCKVSRVQKKVLILDEIWSLIGARANSQSAEFVLEVIKTYRGYGACVLTATQDLLDFFALENGKYGKAILNNSRIKIILPLEEDEAMRVKEILNLSEEETLQIIRNQRGEGLLCAGQNRINVAFQPTQKEYDIITTSRDDLEKQMQTVQH